MEGSGDRSGVLRGGHCSPHEVALSARALLRADVAAIESELCVLAVTRDRTRGASRAAAPANAGKVAPPAPAAKVSSRSGSMPVNQALPLCVAPVHAVSSARVALPTLRHCSPHLSPGQLALHTLPMSHDYETHLSHATASPESPSLVSHRRPGEWRARGQAQWGGWAGHPSRVPPRGGWTARRSR